MKKKFDSARVVSADAARRLFELTHTTRLFDSG